MDIFARRLKECRENKKKENPEYTQDFVAKKIGVARTTYTAYENGTKMPPLATVNIIADFFNVTTDYLLGRSKINYQSVQEKTGLYETVVNDKNERDIAKRIEKFREEIENSDGLAFSGEPLSDEAKESLIESMEHIFRQTQRINKKYIPKKYRDDE